MPAYRFFASYARANVGRDHLLLKFCEDLNESLRRKISMDEQYFFDTQSIPPGGVWPDTLEAALRSARSFLAFYSPAYFNSPDCGREIKAFQMRMESYQQLNPGEPCFGPLGVLWESQVQLQGKIPESLRDLQYNVPPHRNPERTVELLQMVSERGLRQLLYRASLGSVDDKLACADIVECYAEHIQRITGACDLSAYGFPGQYRDLPYDFPYEERVDEDTRRPPPLPRSTAPKGPKFIKVLLLVGTANSFATVPERTVHDCYDAEDDRLWKPYLPEEEEIFLLVNRAITAEKGIIETIRWNNAPDREALLRAITETEVNNNVLLVIVDPWSCFLTQLKTSFEVVDERRMQNGAIFLPWNHEDIDTKTKLLVLQDQLDRVFARISGDGSLTQLIYDSPAALETQLRAKIVQLRSRIVARAARAGQLRTLPPGSPLPTVAVPSR